MHETRTSSKYKLRVPNPDHRTTDQSILMTTPLLKELGLDDRNVGTYSGEWLFESEPRYLHSVSPIDGSEVGKVTLTSDRYYEQVLSHSLELFKRWRNHPAPLRGELIRQVGDSFRKKKLELGALITMETGKSINEAEGEVQEVIDICDFAVGLSRQLYGKSMHAERSLHRMYEQWHPLGPIGVITAFNYPAAVWAWNAMIAAVCGDVVIWKGSELTPLSSIACIKLSEKVFSKAGFGGVFSLVTGEGPALGARLAADKRLPLISATGSTAMGRSVGEVVTKRLGRSLLELGGNNAITVLKDGDLELAARAICFAAVGTAGQRCTTARRVLVEQEVFGPLSERLIQLYGKVRIGNPLSRDILMGPLIHQKAVAQFELGVERSVKEGGKILFGGHTLQGLPSPLYVEPTIIHSSRSMSIIKEEIFAPILHLIPVSDLDEAIDANNEVPHGLSSALFSKSLQATEKFLSSSGSDCGIANINSSTSQAEIGGAFGGEKDTGGGREAGSDSWKAYMRRQTTTINFGNALPLAQGIEFDV